MIEPFAWPETKKRRFGLKKEGIFRLIKNKIYCWERATTIESVLYNVEHLFEFVEPLRTLPSTSPIINRVSSGHKIDETAEFCKNLLQITFFSSLKNSKKKKDFV